MKKWIVTGVVALLATAAVAWALTAKRAGLPRGALAALRGAETFELLTLDPGQGWMWSGEEAKNPDPAKFHHVIVLGRQIVASREMREALINSLDQSLRNPENTQGRCFNPRHGIRATTSGKSVDILICFECHGIVILEGDRRTTLYLNQDKAAETAYQQAVKTLGLPESK